MLLMKCSFPLIHAVCPCAYISRACGRRAEVGAPPGTQRSFLDQLLEPDRDCLASLFADRLPHVRFDRELVRSVAHGHERALEGVTVDRALDAHKTARPKEVCRAGHHHVRPAALRGALLEFCPEPLTQPHLHAPIVAHSSSTIS